jgi:hypothetical protein
MIPATSIEGNSMKTFFYSLLLLAALASPAVAQTNVAGTWQGRLEVAPGKMMAIHFVIAAAPGGGYSAIVTSPDDGAIKNVRAKSIKYAENRLTIDVPELSGAYAGTLRNGIFEGEWSQEGAKLPLTLKPYETPALTKADIDALRGAWSGLFKANGLEVTIVLRFSTGGDGTLLGVLDVPEQGVKDWAASDIRLDDGHFLFEQPQAQVKIEGVLRGDQIVGHWNQLGNSVPLTLKKGGYVAPARYLDLAPTAREQLKGRWIGTLNGLAVVVRFETDTQGRMLGFFDSTQQNLLNLPIKEAELAGAKLTFGMAFGAKYTGELSGSKLTGQWTQIGLPSPLPLTLTREE